MAMASIARVRGSKSENSSLVLCLQMYAMKGVSTARRKRQVLRCRGTAHSLGQEP